MWEIRVMSHLCSYRYLEFTNVGGIYRCALNNFDCCCITKCPLRIKKTEIKTDGIEVMDYVNGMQGGV